MTTPNTPKTRRRLWRIAAWMMGSTFTLLLLTLAGAAWWLWGWQWHSSMSFHESWTAEERTALTQFERYLHTELPDDMGLVYEAVEDTMEEIVNEVSAEEEENDDETTDEWTDESKATPKAPLGLTTRLTMAVLMKLQIAPIDAALHEVAATGKGDPAELVCTLGGDKTTPALLAAQLGDFPALRALINHGADPNVIMTYDGREVECMLSPLLNGMFINSRTIPWEQRREMLDFLISHGADLNRSKKMVPLSLNIALQAREEPQVWLWALEHGQKVSTEDFCEMLEAPDGTPLVEYVLAHQMVNVNDNSGKRTPLQALAEGLWSVAAEAIETSRYEERLDLMLAAGADPNLTTESTRRTPLQIMQSRTDFERSDGMPENSCCIEGPDIRTRWQMLCDKLRAAGVGNDSPTTTDEEDENTNDEEEYDEEEYEDSDDEIDEEDLENEESENSEDI